MDLQNQFLPVLINNFIEDVFYGCCWIDETGIFILKIPPEYCRISGKYFTGDYSFSIDMSKYKKYEDVLEYLGDPLQSMYKAYGGDSKNKWQPMPDEYALCTKSRVETWETIVPIYSGLFIDLIGLLNLADVQAVADEQQIYKLITATIPTVSGADEPDMWSVNIDFAVDYYNKLVESLPPYIGSVITPLPLNTISFSDDQTTDTTKVQKATKEVLNTSGGAQILNSSTISGAEAFRAATRADTELAISALLGQIQGWTNRMLSYQISNPAKVKFFEVSAYTKDALKESMQKDLQYDSSNVFDSYFVYEGWCTDKIYRQGYTKDGDNVSFEGERTELFRELLTASEKAELESIRANYAELKSFKENVEKNELHSKKEEILNSEKYAVLAQKDEEGKFVNEAYSKLVSEMDNYSLADLETQIKVIHSDYMSEHSNFSISTPVKEEKKPVSKKQFVNVESTEKPSRYGKLFSKEE